MEGFDRIMFAQEDRSNPNPIINDEAHLGKRNYKIDQIPSNYGIDDISKKLKKLNSDDNHLISTNFESTENDSKPSSRLPQNHTKALSSTGFDTQFMTTARNVIINHTPMTFNFHQSGNPISMGPIPLSPPNQSIEEQTFLHVDTQKGYGMSTFKKPQLKIAKEDMVKYKRLDMVLKYIQE